MIKASPIFTEDGSFEVQRKAIFSEQHGCSFYPVTSREDGLHGLNISYAFADELARYKDLSTYFTVAEATSTRPNSLIIGFSTHDARPNNPLVMLNKSYEARKKSGLPVDNWSVTSFSADLEADPNPLSDFNMFKANPSAKHIPELLETLEEERIQAATSDYALGRWKITRLNIAGVSDSQYIDPAKWAACAHPEGRGFLNRIDRRPRRGGELDQAARSPGRGPLPEP